MEVDFVGLAQDFILVAIDFMGEIEDKMESTCQKRLVVTVHISYEEPTKQVLLTVIKRLHGQSMSLITIWVTLKWHG